MTKITAVLAVPASGAVPVPDPQLPSGTASPPAARPVPHADLGRSPGKEAGETVSVGLVLNDPADRSSRAWAAWGDCVVPAHPSAGATPASQSSHLSMIRDVVAPTFTGRQITSFREMAAPLDTLTHEVRVPAPTTATKSGPERLVQGDSRALSRRDLLSAPLRLLRPEAPADETGQPLGPPPTQYTTTRRSLPSAVRYGVSQALLQAVAWTHRLTMAEIIAEEWSLPSPVVPVPVQAACVPGRHQLAERMIATRPAALGYVLAEDVREQMEDEGSALVRDVQWLTSCLTDLWDTGYRPTIYVGLGGSLGRLYEGNLGRVLGYLQRLESAARPYALRVEDPVIMESRGAQIERMRTLREYVRFRDMRVTLVAAAWATSVDAVQAFTDAEAADAIRVELGTLGGIHTTVDASLACKANGMGVLLAAGPAATDLGAHAAAHIALAVQPDVLLIDGSLGMERAVGTVRGEMARSLALIEARGGA